MKKLAIITTHPIQYYAPVFKLLSQRGNLNIHVFYTRGEKNGPTYDHGFNKEINWDVPLLDGYSFTWVENAAREPGSHHYKGIINPGLIEQLEQWRPDAILIFGWAYQSHSKLMRYFKDKVPVYFRGDSNLLNNSKGIKKVIKYLFLRRIYKNVDHAFYVGANNKAYFKKYGLKDSQLSFAPHAIDNDRFKTDHSEEAKELRASLDISDEKILILYAGKFEPVKNVELLLSAFIKLNSPNAHLLLVGNGINEPQLKRMANEYMGAENIHFEDFKNQSYMPVLYQAADLFCLPSLNETWGLAVNEAMACGRAVLVSDRAGCVADLVKEDFNGAIFKSEKLDDLVACLRKLTNDRQKLKTYGQNSKNIIKDWTFLNIALAVENKSNEIN